MIEAKKPFVLWLLGLSGAGKSTIADALKEKLDVAQIKNERLDGDIVREVFPQTGFDKQSRINHNKKTAWLASILERNGVSVVSSFISPYEESREYTRNKCKNYIEVYVATSLEECEQRDVKGLYAKVRSGEIKNFTGIDDPFEQPNNADLTIFTEGKSVEESTQEVWDFIQSYLG